MDYIGGAIRRFMTQPADRISPPKH